jgi:hypothetical protein
MVNSKNVEKFQGYIVDLLSFLKKAIPDEKLNLNKVQAKYRQMDKVVYLNYILNNLQGGIDYITRNDEYVFTPEFSTKPLNYLIGYDFRKVWSRPLTNEQRKVIFRYLQLIYIQASKAVDKNAEKVKNIIDSIQAQNEIEKEAKENPDAFDDNPESMDFQKLFGDDNLLIELAKDISSEINIQDVIKDLMASGDFQMQPGQNPQQMFQKLANNPMLMEKISGLREKVGQKLSDRNVSQEDVMKSVDNLKTSMMKYVSNMPGGSQIKKMLKNMDIDKFMQNNVNESSGIGGSDGSEEIDPNDFMQKLMSQMDTNLMSPEFTQMMQNMQSQYAADPDKFKEMISQSNNTVNDPEIVLGDNAVCTSSSCCTSSACASANVSAASSTSSTSSKSE